MGRKCSSPRGMGNQVTMEAMSNFLPKKSTELPGSLSHRDSIWNGRLDCLPSRGLP